MQRRIGHVSELPEWFDREKYAEAANLDAAGWYEQLQVRRDLSSMIPRSYEDSWMCDFLEQARLKPIVDTENDAPFCFAFDQKAISDAKATVPKYALGVSIVSLRLLLSMRQGIDEDRRKEAEEWWEKITDPDFDEFLSADIRSTYRYWFDEPLSNSTTKGRLLKQEAVIINLELPDALLVKGFRRFLAACRARRDQPLNMSRYRAPDFDQLHYFGVLPFIDLKIWAKEYNLNIPNRVLADAIFPNGEGGEEVIRKTTQKLAKKWLLNLDTLLAEIAHEDTSDSSPATDRT